MGYFVDTNSFLDHRVIFVAACSSFVTLFILSIFNKCHYIKHKGELDALKSQQSQQYIEPLLNNAEDTEEKKQQIQVSESSITLLCKDMITEDFYIHEKTQDYFEKDIFLNLIPKDTNWTKRRIKLLIDDSDNYNEQLHLLMLDNFNPINIEPKTNMCINELCNGIKLFNQWRKWTNGSDSITGWKYRTTTKDKCYVYTHTLPDSQLDVVKSEQIFPFNISVVVGVLLSNRHFQLMDPSVKSLKMIKNPSLSSHIIHMCVKCPFPVADRDFVNVCGIYIFKDGSCLIENVKCSKQELVPPTKGYVRGEITLSMYHIRPYYDSDIQQTKVTFYSHVDIGGSIPSWVLNSSYMETANSVPNLCKYIQSLYKKKIIHKPGQLSIPPNPFMKMLGIDIKQ